MKIFKKKNKINEEINIIKKKSKIKKMLNKINIFTKKERDIYSFEEVLIVMIFSLGLGFAGCFSFIKIFNSGKNYLVLANDLSDFVEAYNTITENYYGEVDKDTLVQNAISGMVSSVGDIYTNFSDAVSSETFNQTVGGVYEGIGCTIFTDENGNIVVAEVYKDSPASVAGLQPNDIIIKVNGIDYTEKTSTEVSDYIKNSSEKEVKVTIKRDNVEKVLKIERDTVEIPIIESEVFEKNNKKIGYISISLFSSVSDTQFAKALKELEAKKIDSLVIDVRSNGGGYLSAVTNITSSLLKKGKTIYQLEESNANTTIKKDETNEKRTYPIAVLINEGSASASEILASAIKESYGGYIVGTNSYGKGTVQQTVTLSSGSMLKYTVEKWLTPNGNWIDGTGVEPTNIIEQSEDYYEDPTYENDTQLQEAINILSK